MTKRKPYPTDVSDEEWSFAAPYLTLMTEDAPQRRYELREMFNALRWMARAGAAWRMLPTNFPSWQLVYQQTQRWLNAGCFEAMVNDLRSIIRVAQDRQGQPSAVILDGRTLQSTCESGPRAGYDGYKRKRGSKVHMAVDTLGNLLAVHITPANEQERAQVQELAQQVQHVTGQTVKLAFADQAIRVTRLRRLPVRKGLSCRSSSCPRRRRASCCCPAVG
jgi:transposase